MELSQSGKQLYYSYAHKASFYFGQSVYLVKEKTPHKRGFLCVPGTVHQSRRGTSDLVRCYFFLAAMASLRALPGRNLGTLASAILISLPVCGFLPVRA